MQIYYVKVKSAPPDSKLKRGHISGLFFSLPEAERFIGVAARIPPTKGCTLVIVTPKTARIGRAEKAAASWERERAASAVTAASA